MPMLREGVAVLALLMTVPSPLAGEGQKGGSAGIARRSPHPDLPPQGGKEASAVKSPALISAGAAEILAAVRAPGAAATLVNVWATWCVPCREEFPELLRLRAAYAERGLRVLFVSGDFDSERGQVDAFLRQHGVDFPTYFKTGGDMEFIDAVDPGWNGALPATFVYDAGGQRRRSVFGKSSYETFEQAVKAVLESRADE